MWTYTTYISAAKQETTEPQKGDLAKQLIAAVGILFYFFTAGVMDFFPSYLWDVFTF